MKTDHLITTFGLCRSGTHAVIYWMLGQSEDPKEFFNNQKLYGTCSARKVTGDYKLAIVGHEDYNIPKRSPYMCNEEKRFGKVDKRTSVIIMRDPYNLFASRLGHKIIRQLTIKNRKKFIKIWKNWGREFLGDTKHVPNKLGISFNQWFSDKSYRQKIAQHLGIPFNDTNINKLSLHGRGSSFDKKRFANDAHKMNVLGRWKHMVNDNTYMRIFQDKEIIEISDRIFGKAPDGFPV